MSTFTGYKATKYVVNPRLKEVGIKEIPPQMLYTYIKKGMIDSVEVNGQRLVEEKVLLEWTEQYIARKLERTAQKEQEIEEQLAGKE